MSEIRSGKKIRRGFLGCFLAGVLAVSGSVPVPVTAAPNTVYVSGSAVGDGDGTDRLRPLDSIYDAAQLLSEGGSIQVTDTFYITGERTYRLPEGICIEAADDLQGPIFQVEKGGKLTLNNIVINGKDSTLIANYGTVNVEGNVTFLKSGQEVSTASAVDTDAAAVTYAGGARIEGSEAGMNAVNWEQWTDLSAGESTQKQEGESEEETTTETEEDGQKEEAPASGDADQEEETQTSEDVGQEEETQTSEGIGQEEVQVPAEDESQEEAQEPESDNPKEVNNPENESQEESIQDTEKEEGDQNLKDEKGEDAVQETESSENAGDVIQDSSEEADESPDVDEENGETDRESKAGEEQKAADGEEEAKSGQESVQLAAGIEAVEALRSGRANATEETQKTEEIRNLEKRIAALQVNSREDAEEAVEITKAYEKLGDYEAGRISEIAKEQLAEAQTAAGAYNHTCEDVSVTGNIPWYVQLRATRLEIEEKQENGLQILVPYELKLWNLMTDEAYELPEGESAVVRLPVPDVEMEGEFSILHHKSDGSVETLIPTVKGDTMSFETSSFSVFSVAGSTVMAGIGVTEESDGLSSGGTSVGSGAMAGIAVAVDSSAAGVRRDESSNSSETEENPAPQTESQQKEDSVSQEASGNLAAVFTGDETKILPFLLLGIGSGMAAVIAMLDGKRNKKRA